MTSTILLAVTLLLLISYAFDLTSEKTKIPSVLLLLFTGWLLKVVMLSFNIVLVDFSSVLPVLGTLGLILIVLEGSLDLEFTHKKKKVIIKTFAIALLPIIILTVVFASAFCIWGGVDLRSAILNAIPFCIISSAIAIPSVRFFDEQAREFVIYESSFSDIIGIILFNFFALNTTINLLSIGNFFIGLFVMFLISLVMTLFLANMINRIQYHVKYIPIILFIVLTYAISKSFHLPALLFILFFGLAINNFHTFADRLDFLHKIGGPDIHTEISRFKEIVVEAAFLVRSAFFLLFGFQIETNELLNLGSFLLALPMVAAIFIVRVVVLKLFRVRNSVLIYFVPRGLIMILLLLSIEPPNRLPFISNSLTIQVIILTSLALMIGVFASAKTGKNKIQEFQE